MSLLFSQARLGALTLQNHLVMSPMTRNRATGNIPNALMAEYYAQRVAITAAEIGINTSTARVTIVPAVD